MRNQFKQIADYDEDGDDADFEDHTDDEVTESSCPHNRIETPFITRPITFRHIQPIAYSMVSHR